MTDYTFDDDAAGTDPDGWPVSLPFIAVFDATLPGGDEDVD